MPHDAPNSSQAFDKKWSNEIERHKKQLLKTYISRISFPLSPYSPEEITAYIQVVRPYIRRSLLIKRAAVVSAITFLLFCIWLYDYQKQKRLASRVDFLREASQSIGWNLNIEGPRYTRADVERYEDQYSRIKFYLKLENTPQRSFESVSFEDTYIKPVSVKSGEFTMGCTKEQEEECYNRELPTHKVKIGHSFYMGRYEVTQKLYREVTGENPSLFSTCGLSCPVENVSWYDAVRFTNKLNEKLGLEPCYAVDSQDPPTVTWPNKDCSGWRLPTEAEWEYAARGGQKYKYSGSHTADKVAWYNAKKTHSVGLLQSNGYGLHDMSGNVHEWVWDIWSSYTKENIVNPVSNNASKNIRLNRGGSWNRYRGNVRVSYRLKRPSSAKGDFLGFRILRIQP